MKKGFTLIELLIVIAILGILATALLTAIDPLEQFRKATDSGRRTKAREMLSASQRYALKGTPLPTAASFVTLAPIDNPAEGIITTLVGGGELTAKITENAGELNKLYYGKNTDDGQTVFCFLPDSKSVKSEAMVDLGADVLSSGALTVTDGSAGCATCGVCLY